MYKPCSQLRVPGCHFWVPTIPSDRFCIKVRFDWAEADRTVRFCKSGILPPVCSICLTIVFPTSFLPAVLLHAFSAPVNHLKVQTLSKLTRMHYECKRWFHICGGAKRTVLTAILRSTVRFYRIVTDMKSRVYYFALRGNAADAEAKATRWHLRNI